MRRKLFSNPPDPMNFVVSESGEDEKGKYAVVSAENIETGEIVTKKMYEDKTYNSQKDFSETGKGEDLGMALGASGLAAGLGYVGSKEAKNADKLTDEISDRIRNRKKGKTSDPGITEIKPRGKAYQKTADLIDNAGKKVKELAGKKGGKVAMIATPAVIAGGTTYIVRRKKKNKRKE